MNKSIFVGLVICAIAVSIQSAMTKNTAYGTAGTHAMLNCEHCNYEYVCIRKWSLHDCYIKAIIEKPTLTDVEEPLRLFSNPLANVNMSTKVPANLSSLPANITDIPTSISNIDSSKYDVAELDCKYERSTQEISDCDVLGIIQIDRNNPDEIRMIQNPMLTLNFNGRIQIPNSTFLDSLYDNSSVQN